MTLIVTDATGRRHSIALVADPSAVYELKLKECAKAKPKRQPSVEDTAKIEIQASTVYSHYPRKVGRPGALRKIAKAIRASGYDYVLDRVKQFAAAWADAPKSELQYCPHPATWFNQERYNDEPETWNREARTERKAGIAKRDRNAALSGEARGKSQLLSQYARKPGRGVPESYPVCEQRELL